MICLWESVALGTLPDQQSRLLGPKTAERHEEGGDKTGVLFVREIQLVQLDLLTEKPADRRGRAELGATRPQD
jgi:hypothetical protein